MSKTNALKGLDVAIKALRTSRKVLEKAIAQKRFREEEVDREIRAKARITRKLATLRLRKVQVDAAQVVVAAPTLGDIQSVMTTLRRVEALAVADAARKAGFDLVTKLVADASGLAGKVKT